MSRDLASANANNLIAGIEVDLIRLSECLVDTGWRLDLGAADIPGIHYCLSGTGRMRTPGHPVVDLEPHTLVILPAGVPFQVEATSTGEQSRSPNVYDGRLDTFPDGAVCRYQAGGNAPNLIMICGHFCPTYGATVDLFAGLSLPIVERFGAVDRLDQKLGIALEELAAQEVGSDAVTTGLLKQVVVALIRRSIGSVELWAQRFAPVADPQVARAFAAMVSRPGAIHTIESLAAIAGLSRSAFMARFVKLFDKPPATILRDLRMRRAATLFASGKLAADRVAAEVGYASRSSFLRAFRETQGCSPAAYREALEATPTT